MKDAGCVLVSWDFSNGKDKSIALVGIKSRGQSANIINAFEGNEAEELILKLLTKKTKEGTE